MVMLSLEVCVLIVGSNYETKKRSVCGAEEVCGGVTHEVMGLSAEEGKASFQ